MAVLAPLDHQFAAVEQRRWRGARSGRAGRQRPARRRRRSRRPGSGRRRVPRPRSRMRSAVQRPARSRYWRARGRSGRVPAPGPARPIGTASDVRHEEDRVRVAHADTPPGRPAAPRASGRCSVSMALGQRDLAPVEPGRRPYRPRPRPSGSASVGRSPAMVSHHHLARPVSAASRQATQRVALPQAPTSAPSGLRMRMKASAPSRPGSMHDQLVAADAAAAVGDGGGAGGREAQAARRAHRARRSRCRGHASCGRASSRCPICPAPRAAPTLKSLSFQDGAQHPAQDGIADLPADRLPMLRATDFAMDSATPSRRPPRPVRISPRMPPMPPLSRGGACGMRLPRAGAGAQGGIGSGGRVVPPQGLSPRTGAGPVRCGPASSPTGWRGPAAAHRRNLAVHRRV